MTTRASWAVFSLLLLGLLGDMQSTAQAACTRRDLTCNTDANCLNFNPGDACNDRGDKGTCELNTGFTDCCHCIVKNRPGNPAASHVGAGVLSLLLLGSGVVMIRRYRLRLS